MIRLTLATSFLSLAACSTASHFFAPNGEDGFVLRCNGHYNDMASCYNMAHDHCRGPYRIVNGAVDQDLASNKDAPDEREITVVCTLKLLEPPHHDHGSEAVE